MISHSLHKKMIFCKLWWKCKFFHIILFVFSSFSNRKYLKLKKKNIYRFSCIYNLQLYLLDFTIPAILIRSNLSAQGGWASLIRPCLPRIPQPTTQWLVYSHSGVYRYQCLLRTVVPQGKLFMKRWDVHEHWNGTISMALKYEICRSVPKYGYYKPVGNWTAACIRLS